MSLLRVIFKDRSLGFKFGLLSVLPIVLVTVFIVLIIINALERSIIEKTEMRAQGLTKLFVLSMSNPFVIYNKELLDNIVDSLDKEKNIIYAMIVDSSDNRILAHSDHERDGDILDVPASAPAIQIGKSSSRLKVTKSQGYLYELSAPVIIKNIKYGVVSVGFSAEEVYQEIASMKHYVISIGIVAVLLGVLSSILLARFIGKPVKALAAQAEQIGGGDFEQRMIYQSNDALGQLAFSFNKMTEQLRISISMLKENEAKYRALFEYSPISLWEEDFSRVKEYIESLRKRGIRDLRVYFHDHPEEVANCINMIRILNVNESTLQLYEADSKEEFLERLRHTRTDETYQILIEGLVSLAEGKPFEIEGVYRTLRDNEITVLARSTIPPGYESTWGKAFLSIQDLTERVRAEFLEKMFGRYLSKEVMDILIENPDAIRLGGEKRPVTIMLTDLRGFTAISERLEPEQVVQMLNTYFEVMVDVVNHYHGTIIEIIGDALLVIFGAPHEMPDRAQRAIACAIAMQNAMEKVNQLNRAEGLPELQMGIGVNEAEVIVGNIGSRKRSKYGVVGSGVNMASRIESYTVGGQVLISESCRKEAGEVLRIDSQMEVHPKGAETPITIYEVGGIGGEYQIALMDISSRAVALDQQIPIRYAVLDGKYVGEGASTGAIVRLSRKSGELRLQATLEPLTNLKLNLADVSEDLARKDFYGKVIERSDADPRTCQVQFTALPPGIDGYFQAALQHGAQEDRPG